MNNLSTNTKECAIQRHTLLMRKAALIVSIFIIGQTGFGQTLFFDNLKNTNWTTGENFTEVTLHNAQQIPLSKLSISKDSITKNVTILAFNDSTITISNYDYLRKTDNLVGTFNYSILPEPLRLEIKLDNGATLQFKAGITSTGFHAILFKAKNIYANFKAILHIETATKDGIYMNGYVVDIPFEKAKKLNGKTVQIKGKVTIVPGIDDNENGIIEQGRNMDTRHILKPKIKIVEGHPEKNYTN